LVEQTSRQVITGGFGCLKKTRRVGGFFYWDCFRAVMSMIAWRSPTRRFGGRFLAKMYYVYILQSNKDKKLYTGRTENLELRLEEHNLGKVKSTKNRRPLKLIYYEAYKDKQDAIDRELFLKSGRGREVIQKQLKNSILK